MKATPAIYKRWISSICSLEGFNHVSLAPGENYPQEVLISYYRNEVDSIFLDLKLGFPFKNLDKTRNTGAIEVWSDVIRIPSDTKK